MRDSENNRQSARGLVELLGGLTIAALSFFAGMVEARSRVAIEPNAREAIVRTETGSAGAGTTVEPRRINSSDQGGREGKVPGHSELDLQLD